MINSKIRQNAKLRMNGKWSSALTVYALICAVMLTLSLALEFTAYLLNSYHIKTPDPSEWSAITLETLPNALLPFLISVPILMVTFLVYQPLKMGEASFYWHNANQKNPSVQCVLEQFRKGRYMRAVSAGFFVKVYEAVWALVCFLPALLIFPITYNYLEQKVKLSDTLVFTALFAAAFILFFIGLYAFFLAIQRYFLVPYLLAADENMSAAEALHVSKKIMAGKSTSALHFQLTFLGWFALCLFVLPLIYVLPYFRQARAEYACALLGVQTLPPERVQLTYQPQSAPQYRAPYPNYPNGYYPGQPQNPYGQPYRPNASYPPTYPGGYYGVQNPNQYYNGYYGAGYPNPYRPQQPIPPNAYRNPNAATPPPMQNTPTAQEGTQNKPPQPPEQN